MLQEEVQKMRAEQAAAARREKTLMKKKMKDNIKSSGKITSFFQRKQIAVVATAQPAEEDPDKEVSRRTIARKCNEQIELLFQQTQSYQDGADEGKTDISICFSFCGCEWPWEGGPKLPPC
mmetsp:Transcript_44730/g.72971  ORF Transcript_44730/g.72971 Transcript_44730/m.72971 type:complete len:121 (+) Transcript_44730:156-518(+)